MRQLSIRPCERSFADAVRKGGIRDVGEMNRV
jgi:hypothetical protein